MRDDIIQEATRKLERNIARIRIVQMGIL